MTSRIPRAMTDTRQPRWLAFAMLLCVAACTMLAGCRDKNKELMQQAVVPRDTKQVREGLVKGGEEIARHLNDDPGADIEGVKRAISRARASVHELAIAKSSFFIFVAPDGTVLRSQTEPDLPAGKSLTEAIPDAKKIFTEGAGPTEVWGYMEGLRFVNKGNDLQWVVGVPVKSKDEKVIGAFVTGWSLRHYANVLETHVKAYFDKHKADAKKPAPLVYAFVVKGKKGYGARMTPDENATAVGELDLITKAKDGMYQTKSTVDGREFSLVAKLAPALGADVAVALRLSVV